MLVFDVLVFLFIWFSMFLWHELMHCLEAYRQGSQDVYIIPDFPGFSMSMVYNGLIYDKSLISLAGGVYTSVLCFPLALLSDGVWQFSFLTLGWVQLFYGVFEYRYLHVLSSRRYRWGRYVLYVFMVLANLLFWWWIK